MAILVEVFGAYNPRSLLWTLLIRLLAFDVLASSCFVFVSFGQPSTMTKPNLTTPSLCVVWCKTDKGAHGHRKPSRPLIPSGGFVSSVLHRSSAVYMPLATKSRLSNTGIWLSNPKFPWTTLWSLEISFCWYATAFLPFVDTTVCRFGPLGWVSILIFSGRWICWSSFDEQRTWRISFRLYSCSLRVLIKVRTGRFSIFYIVVTNLRIFSI